MRLKMWMRKLWKQKKEHRPKIAVLLDYENIATEGAGKGSVITFKRLNILLKECSKLGNTVFRFAFLPDHFIKSSTGSDVLKDLHTAGFWPIPCKSTNESKNGKEKDRVDTIMCELGQSLIDETLITHIIIISHDGDFLRLANYATSHGVKPIVMAGEKVSFLLKQVVDLHLPLPAREKKRNKKR